MHHKRTLATSNLTLSTTVAIMLMCCSALSSGEDIIKMQRKSSGGLYVEASHGKVNGQYLLDTGATLTTLRLDHFNLIQRESPEDIRTLHRVMARTADNRLQPMQVYEIAHFVLAENCDIGPIQIAVSPNAGRNLLGLSALERSAPFTIDLSSLELRLSKCSSPETPNHVVNRHDQLAAATE